MSRCYLRHAERIYKPKAQFPKAEEGSHLSQQRVLGLRSKHITSGYT
jgi:hypothetical protein